MGEKWIGRATVLAGMLLAGTAHAAVVFQDTFDGDGLGVNTNGIGGGMANNTIDAPASWQENEDLVFVNNNANYQNRAIAYSTNTFQSAEGFTLVVFYTSDSVVASLQNRLSFGLVSTNTDLTAYSGFDPFAVDNSVYSIGAEVTAAGGNQGLNFTDGSSVTNLDASGDNVQFAAGATTPVSISVLPDGFGGADWEYSIDGIMEASGNMASFDFATAYRFAVYAQDNEFSRSLQAVYLYEGSAEGINLAPVASDQSVTTYPDVPVDITLDGVDPEGSDLIYSIVDSPTNGTLTGATNVWTYTPANGFQGADSFTFTVNDGELASELATVSITVTNVMPVANTQSVTAVINTPLDITLTGTDADNGPSNLTYTVESQPVNGTLSTNGALPALIYTPNTGYQGADSFTFSVFDGLLTSDPATISITVTNFAPTANAQQVFTESGSNVVITLSGSDPEGSSLTYSVGAPANGSLSGTAPNLTYTPNPGHEGADSFTFTVNDGSQDSAPATVKVWVEPGGVVISFTELNASTNANTLLANGSASNLTVVGAASGNDYIYSVTYSGADVDGDAINDTLTFDVLVEAFDGSTASTAFTGSEADVNALNGAAVIGTNDVAVTLNANGWAVSDGLMQSGDTLGITIQNLAVAGSKSVATAALNRFKGVTYRETNNSYGHQVVIGEGADSLLATRFNATQYAINGIVAETNPLYVTSANLGGVPSANYQRWNLFRVDFSIKVDPGGVPDIALSTTGGQLVFSWEGGGTYNVLTNAHLWDEDGWGVAESGVTSPVTNAVGSSPQLFFKLAE